MTDNSLAEDIIELHDHNAIDDSSWRALVLNGYTSVTDFLEANLVELHRETNIDKSTLTMMKVVAGPEDAGPDTIAPCESDEILVVYEKESELSGVSAREIVTEALSKRYSVDVPKPESDDYNIPLAIQVPDADDTEVGRYLFVPCPLASKLQRESESIHGAEIISEAVVGLFS